MRNWDALAERSGIYAASDFQMAAYTLMTQQVLYESEARQRVAYHIVRDNLSAFREVFVLFGVEIIHESADGYLVAIPRSQRPSVLTKETTLLILTLARIYRQQIQQGELDEDRAVVSIEELREAYKALAVQDLPADVGSLRALLAQVQRMGIVRMVDAGPGSGQPFDVAVLPGIKTLVSEPVLMRMVGEYQARAEIESEKSDDEEAESEGADETT